MPPAEPAYVATRPRRWDPSFVVEAPRQPVYDYLADPRNRPEWQLSLHSVELLDDGPPRVGMRWVDRLYGGARFTLEIVAMDDAALWAERGQVGPLSATVTLLTEDAGAAGETATRVTVMTRLEGPGPLWLLARVATAVMAVLVRADLPRMKDILRKRG